MLSLPSEVIDRLNSGRFSIRRMIRFDLDAGSEGIWNDTYTVLDEDEVNYAPLAGNMEFDPVPASSALAADFLRVRVSGLSPAVHDFIDGTAWHQRPATYFVAFLDEAGEIIHMIPRFSGFVDTAPVQDQADGTCVLTINIESNNRQLSRSSDCVRSDSDQRKRSATDGFYKYTGTANTDVQINWGRKGPQYPVARR